MKRFFPAILGSLLAFSGILCVIPPCGAENEVLKRECEAKVAKAAELIRTLGDAAAFQKITDPEGPFVDKKSHVFCIDADSGALLAHKVTRFVGSNMNYYMDSDGNNPYTGMLQKARPGEVGWVTYTTYGSGPERRKTPGLKNMSFFKVPGKNIVLCCGYWEDT